MERVRILCNYFESLVAHLLAVSQTQDPELVRPCYHGDKGLVSELVWSRLFAGKYRDLTPQTWVLYDNTVAFVDPDSFLEQLFLA